MFASNPSYSKRKRKWTELQNNFVFFNYLRMSIYQDTQEIYQVELKAFIKTLLHEFYTLWPQQK